MVRLITFWVVLISFSATAICSASELEDRKHTNIEVAQLFEQKHFGELNNLAQLYRLKESRTSSGLWMLTLLYSGIYNVTEFAGTNLKRWSEIEQTGRDWMAYSPDEAAPYLVQANTLIGHGWAYRGDGWAYEVRKENWPIFYRYLRQARKLLLQHKDIASVDPRWYELMIVIARGEQWDRKRFDQLVSEAVSRHPYFYQIYFAAIDYLLPKWNGNAAEIEKFADWTVTKTRTMEGDGMYARIYWYASQTQYGTKLFTESAVVWKKMRKGIRDVLSRYPDQWNVQNFALFSCLARDKDFTKELIGYNGEKIMVEAWKNKANYYNCRNWAFSRN